MADEREQKFWKEFIQILQEHPCLWDVKCKDYKNGTKRVLAYGILVEKLWEFDDNADIELVKQMIKSFRETFRQEVNKIKEMEKCGVIFQSKWCYYPDLLFLLPQLFMPGRDMNEKVKTDDSNSDILIEETKDNYVMKNNIIVKEEPDVPSTTGISGEKASTSHSLNIQEQDVEDDCSTFAAHLKTRMRSFDPQQKCIAQKLISNVLFMAETKQLGLNTQILNL